MSEKPTIVYDEAKRAQDFAAGMEIQGRAHSVIKPTIGRRVWYWPARNCAEGGFAYNDPSQPCDAGIAYVQSDRMINVSVADQNGVVHAKTSVQLLQEGDARPEFNAFAEWMPYQVGQAKKGGA